MDFELAPSPRCPICADGTAFHGEVDFNRSCEERRGKFLPVSGHGIAYHRCAGCGFSFAPEMHGWSLETFASRVYNDEYAEVDPDYLIVRPQTNALNLLGIFPDLVPTGRHLDYGGGNGLMSRTLKQAGWNSTSYDPFCDRDLDPRQLGSFDLITAFEVFEHVPDVAALLETLSDVLRQRGLIFFTTLLSDGQIAPGEPLTWWYAAPRNGHVSLFTRQSLAYLAAEYGFVFTSLSPNMHVFSRDPAPSWANHPTTRRFLAQALVSDAAVSDASAATPASARSHAAAP